MSFNRVVRKISLAGMALCYSGIALAQVVAASEQVSSSGQISKLVTINVQNAPLSEVIADIVTQSRLQISYFPSTIPAGRRVTMKAQNVSAQSALETALRGSGVEVRVLADGQIALARKKGSNTTGQGVIAGKVTDSKTGKGVAGANLSLGTEKQATMTGDDGSYRITGIPAGTHAIVVRLVGYAKQTKSVTVGEGATVTVDFKLEPSANVLDQVIVTGTVVQSEIKSVPNAITVITAKQIEERGITRIDQLFRGDVPGLFSQNQGSNPTFQLDEVVMYSRGATALSTQSAGISGDPNLPNVTFLTNPIKTYIDGVEMADSKYLSQIDPKNIERIEILTGPQASTIYGSNALNGVMQIFTKRGSSPRPKLSLSLMSGWVENNYSSAHTPQHDYSAQISGIEGRVSYNVGGSWNYLGPWTPSKQTSRYGGFGGARAELSTPVGRVTPNLSARRSVTRNVVRGDATQGTTGFQELGWYVVSNRSGVGQPSTSSVNGQTFGLDIGYVPTSWWSHQFGYGKDGSDYQQAYTERGYVFGPSDTLLTLRETHGNRKSLRYTNSLQIPVTSLLQATITTGADSWESLTTSASAQSLSLTGTLTGSPSVSRSRSHNSGAFLQSQIGFNDKLFLTYGLRAEWNPGFGDDELPNYAPRYGVAYTQELGSVTAKLRGSYGRSTRPPLPNLMLSKSASQQYGSAWPAIYAPDYPDFDYYVANPDLGPEYQQGGEGGVELYLGTRASLVVTRYNQTVDELISQVVVDSVDLLPAAKVRYGLGDWVQGAALYKQQYLNVASIRNQGWEMQGSVNVGPVVTRGTYSWSKSRTIGPTPRYRSFFTPSKYPQFQPGATFQYMPEHTWALGLTYGKSATTVGINLSGIGRLTNFQDDRFVQYLSPAIRLPQNRLNVRGSGYVSFNSGYALADMNASHRLSQRIEGVLQVQNLMDDYKNDFWGGYAAIGRQVRAGVRIQ